MGVADEVELDLYRALFDAATVGLKLVHIPDADDPDSFRYVAANACALLALQLTEEAVVGHRLLEVFPGVRGTEVIANYQSCVREQRVVAFGETAHPSPQGDTQWYRAYVVPLRADYVGAVFVNVTAEHDARSQLARANVDLEERIGQRDASLQLSRARLSAIVDRAADRILEVDREGQVRYDNSRATPALESVFELCDERDRPALRAALTRAAAGAPEQLDLQSTRDGEISELSFSISSIHTDGEVCFVVIVRDVTEVRQLRDQMQLRERMATLGTLAAGVAHEINNPLQHLLLALEQIERLAAGDTELDTGRLQSLAGDALSAAEVVGEVVAQLRPFAGAQDQRATVVDVHELIDRAAKLATHELHNLAFEREYRDIPRIRARGRDLTHAFLNLIVNAAQATGADRGGRLRIATRLIGDQIELVFEDNGVGIAADRLGQIFDPFFTTNRLSGSHGMGLGLSICQELVVRNHGTIEVDSAVGEGTRFTLRFPVRAERAVSAADKPTKALPKVLLIDDDPLIGQALQMAMPAYDVASALDGDTALELVAHSDFALIICDAALHESDGYQVYQAVTGAAPQLAERFVFLTGGIVDRTLAHNIEALGLPTWIKPLRGRELQRRITERITQLA